MNAIKLVSNEKGQGLTEYMILVFLVALVSLGTVKSLGSTVMNKLERVQTKLQNDVVLKQD